LHAAGVFAILFLLDAAFGWVVLALAMVSMGGLLGGGGGLMRAHRRLRARRALLAADMTERLPIAPYLAALARRGREEELIARRSAQLAEAALARTTRGEVLRALPDALTGIAATAILLWGATRGLPTGTIAAGFAVLGLIARTLRSLMSVTDRASAYRAAHAKLVAALPRPAAPEPDGEPVRLPPGTLTLELRAAPVAGGMPVTLTVAAAASAVLPAGTDAEAIFSAIAGLEPLLSGDILLNGESVQHLSGGSLHRCMATTTDSPVVLKGSLRRALSLGLLDRPTDRAILSRLQKAGLIPVLEGLGGLDRRLSEAARSLSRAERTGISMLRGALARPGLVLVGSKPDKSDPAVRAWLAKLRATVLSVDLAMLRESTIAPQPTEAK